VMVGHDRRAAQNHSNAGRALQMRLLTVGTRRQAVSRQIRFSKCLSGHAGATGEPRPATRIRAGDYAPPPTMPKPSSTGSWGTDRDATAGDLYDVMCTTAEGRLSASSGAGADNDWRCGATQAASDRALSYASAGSMRFDIASAKV
jgi:hypothetical protein